LEYIENSLSLDDVGGLNVLKKWLTLRGATFSEAAQSFGLTPPKGVLLVGIPGCGKSLTAKCIAAAWNMPLLKLDMGKIFGRYVGDSEANIRQSLLTAEAIAPCVLWIDEIEKGLAGAGDKDSGTTSRVFGSILTWMQDKTSPVFTFATANNINNLPSELLRKGRFDEIFFVDLPDFEERKKILEIHIKKTKRNLKDFDLDRLATISGEETLGEGIRLSGAEIESWVKDALVEAYARRLNGNSQADLSMRDFETVIKRMVPMAKMRLEDFKRLREWANENAVSASVSASGSTTSTDNSSNLFGGRRLDLV
jgi:SpoVK/Ycf46/Vps4 family AAA+-type ATPase